MMRKQIATNTPRRRETGTTPSTREQNLRSARRRPEWNGYLTDDKQYRLNQQQQLQKQLQQLSTAHFASRSPAHSVRRRQMTLHSGASTPSSRSVNGGAGGLQSIVSTPTSRVLNDMRKSTVYSEDWRKNNNNAPPTVSFQLDDDDNERHELSERLHQSRKVNLQGELEVLEQMLRQLETETEQLDQRQYGVNESMRSNHTFPNYSDGDRRQEDRITGSYSDDEEPIESENQEEEGEEEEEEGREENEEEQINPSIPMQQERHMEENSEPRLSEICYKSLSIGLNLAKKMDQLAKELYNERKLRVDQDLKIEVLEQDVRSSRAKCNYLDAKYQDVVVQVDDMREAVIATEEAIHRITLAFEKNRYRSSSKTSTPSTPSRKALRPINVNEHDLVPRKSALKKSPSHHQSQLAPEHAGQQENEPK